MTLGNHSQIEDGIVQKLAGGDEFRKARTGLVQFAVLIVHEAEQPQSERPRSRVAGQHRKLGARGRGLLRGQQQQRIVQPILRRIGSVQEVFGLRQGFGGIPGQDTRAP